MTTRFRPRRPFDVQTQPTPTRQGPSTTALSASRDAAYDRHESGLTRKQGLSDMRRSLDLGARAPGRSSQHTRPPSQTEDYHVLVQISSEAGSALLEPMQAFISAYARGKFRAKVAERVGLATWELLDNAINYGSISDDVHYVLAESRDHVDVRVSNDAVPARLAMLNERAARLQHNAAGVFMDEMARSVQGGIPRAMLGLARVCHEAEMQLEVTVEGRRVTVTARCTR